MNIFKDLYLRYKHGKDRCCDNPDIVVAKALRFNDFVFDYLTNTDGFDIVDEQSSYYRYYYIYNDITYNIPTYKTLNLFYNYKACLSCGKCISPKQNPEELFIALHESKLREQKRKDMAKDICGITD